MADLGEHFSYLEREYASAVAAPLSAKKAMLVAMLIDAYADRLFQAQTGTGDILAFRARLARSSPALALVFALCARREDGPHLAIEPVDVPIADYPALSLEDFMVSVYDGHTVQRVRVVLPDGRREDAHALLADAMQALRAG